MQQTPQNKVTPTTTPKMINHTSKGSISIAATYSIKGFNIDAMLFVNNKLFLMISCW